jgi:hypothetical protein
MAAKLFIVLCIINATCTRACPPTTDLVTSGSAVPYPPSTAITGVTFDWATHVRQAPGSDNWPITWAANGHQYTSWGDGGGFGGTNNDGRASLGVARLEGNWDTYTGFNVWGGKNPENPGQFGGKSYGIISIGGSLYMWVSPGSNEGNFHEARLAVSTDHGATWTKADWAFTEADDLILPTILQFGKDYAGARDNYVYHYAVRLKDDSGLKIQKPGQIDLVRVPKASLLDRDSYEFFAGLKSGNPTWTSNLASRVPVFQDQNGVGWNASVTYNAGLQRYLLATEHTQSMAGHLGLFDAPEPWGPWTTVGYYTNWESRGSNFFWNFSNKWTSVNGKSFTLIFTGSGINDAWNTVRGSFATESLSLDEHVYLPLAVR